MNLDQLAYEGVADIVVEDDGGTVVVALDEKEQAACEA